MTKDFKTEYFHFNDSLHSILKMFGPADEWRAEKLKRCRWGLSGQNYAVKENFD